MSICIFDLSKELACEPLGKGIMIFYNEEDMVAGLLTMEPGQRVPKEGFSAHEGTEFSIVLSGEVTLGTEDGERVIKEGSVTFIPKNTLHYSENRGAEQARIVWVIAPQIKLEV